MPVSFSTDPARLSAALYADGFSLSAAEAAEDLTALLQAGALPLTVSLGGRVLSQGLGIGIDTDCGAMLYLYALTTDRTARGQGLLRTLLKESATEAALRGFIGLCLLPADAALREAYRRMGFTLELPAGGASSIAAPCDLALCLKKEAKPLEEEQREGFYEALGRHMTRGMLDYTLSTLAPAVIPMRAENGYALALAKDPHHALAATAPASKNATHTLLAMPLGERMPPSIPEPLPR